MKRGIIIGLVALLLAGCASFMEPQTPFEARYWGRYLQAPQIGMGESIFLTICPLPYKVNTTTTAYGVDKQYVFKDGVRPKYVYFENGVLTAMQD